MDNPSPSSSHPVQLPSPAQSLRHTKRLIWIIAGVLTILAFLAWLGYQWLNSQNTVKFPIIGPASSWDAQLAFAQSEAKKIDPDSVLIKMSAVDAGALGTDKVDPNTALIILFDFYTASGGDFWLSVVDVNPPTLHQTYQFDRSGEHTRLYKLYSEFVPSTLPTIKISPRQALEIALADAEKRGITLLWSGGIIMYLDNARPEMNQPLHWSLQFEPDLGPDINPHNVPDPYIHYKISPSTGEILSSDFPSSLATLTQP